MTCAIFLGTTLYISFSEMSRFFCFFAFPKSSLKPQKPLTFVDKKPWPKSGVVRNCKWDRRSVRKTQEHPFYFFDFFLGTLQGTNITYPAHVWVFGRKIQAFKRAQNSVFSICVLVPLRNRRVGSWQNCHFSSSLRQVTGFFLVVLITGWWFQMFIFIPSLTNIFQGG